MNAGLPQVALYHPWPRIGQQPIEGWLKSMLLFFDGVALIAPPSGASDLTTEDVAVAEPLLDAGLLHLLDPRTLIDETVAERILSYLSDAAASDMKSQWRSSKGKNFLDWGVVYPGRGGLGSLRLSRPQLEAAETIWSELKRRKFARQTKGSPLLLHPRLWATMEGLLAYLVRPAGLKLGLDLHPASDDEGAVGEQMTIMRGRSRGAVVWSDVEDVALDLSRVPLDEVLAFRADHLPEYRDYMGQLRLFVHELGTMEYEERATAYAERRLDLLDAAEDLRRHARRWWRRPLASMGVGVVGAGVAVSHGDVPSAVLALLGGAVGAADPEHLAQSPYSYILSARDSLVR